jgi:hypothetical protein
MHLPFSAATRTGLAGRVGPEWLGASGRPRGRRGRDRFQVGRGGGMVETKRGSRRVGFPAGRSTWCEAATGGSGRSWGAGVPSGSRSKSARWLEPSRPEVAGRAMPPPARKAGGGPGSRTPRRSGGGGASGSPATGNQGAPAVPTERCTSPPGAAMAAAPANRAPTRRRSLALTRGSWSRKRATVPGQGNGWGGGRVAPGAARRPARRDRPPDRPTPSVFRHSTRTFNIIPTSSCSRMWQWRG